MKGSRLPEKIVQRLRREPVAWDRAMARESEGRVIAQLEKAEVFWLSRPPREPVSLRLDPQDIFLLALRPGLRRDRYRQQATAGSRKKP